MRKALSAKFFICALLLILCALLLIPGRTTHAFTGNDNPEYGYAFAYRLNSEITTLSYDEFMATVNSEPLNFGGTITTEKIVLVESGISRITTRDIYNVREVTFKIYFPHITITSEIKDDADVTGFIRLKNSPITGYKFRYEAERDANDNVVVLRTGTYDNLTMQIYLSKEQSVCTPSTASVKIEVFDGTAWHDIVMPTGTNYNITSVEDTSASPDPALASGLSASIDDCSINALINRANNDRTGVTIHLSGAKFTLNSGRKYHDVTNWFTNLPEGMYAMVSTNVTDEDPSTVHIIFARWIRASVSMSRPSTVETGPITVTVPFDDITALDGSSPWSGLKGGVVVSKNTKAVYNFLTAETMAAKDTPLIVSTTLSGTQQYTDISGETVFEPIDGGYFFTYVFVSQSVYNALVAEKERTGAQKPELKIKLVVDRDIFEFDNSTVVYATCSNFTEITGSGLYLGSLNVETERLIAKEFGTGRFNVSWVIGEREVELDTAHNFVFYKINEIDNPVVDEPFIDPGEDDEGTDPGTGEDGSGDGSTVDEPDIWVNGKDNKKTGTLKKSLIKPLSELKIDLPEGCKFVMSVTGTDVSDISGAVSSGKGKTSKIAKAAYKAKDKAIVVSAGKEAGTVRIWIAAVNKKKAVEASAYFDVNVGIAPKKFYITNDAVGETKGGLKSIALSVGDSVTLYAKDFGGTLSPYACFTWEALKDDGNLIITPSKDTQSAVITIKSAPTGGKTIKASLVVTNVESLKKAKISIPISNEIKSVTGLSEEKNISSALEEAVEEKLSYAFVCSDGGTSTTDKVKVYVTTATEEGTGYTLSNNKFKLTQKSKVKVSYKNGEFVLKVPKKTANGTKIRILIVATHADKTVSVFESGVITIGASETVKS